MTRFIRNSIGTALILLLTSAAAWAQATAQMSGTVRDSSGGVLPGVTVTVTQTDTAFTRTSVTEASGSYVMSNLPTGPYKLEASLQGFRTYVQTGIVLQVNGNPTSRALRRWSTCEAPASAKSSITRRSSSSRCRDAR